MTAFIAECAVEERNGTCGAPTQAFLCSKHKDELVLWLWDVGGVRLGDSGEYQVSLLDELDVTICGDDKISGASIGIAVKSADVPLPFNGRASDAKRTLVNAVQSWARVFAEENPHLIFDPATIEDAARWMAGFPLLLAGHPAAVEMHADIRAVVGDARRAIDRPAQRLYAGNCGQVHEGVTCTAPLFALQGRYEVRCNVCGAEYYVEDRQAEILRGLRAYVTTARAIEGALGAWAGKKLSAKTIRTWTNRGLLENLAPDGETPLVRIGNVLDLARERLAGFGDPTCAEAA